MPLLRASIVRTYIPADPNCKLRISKYDLEFLNHALTFSQNVNSPILSYVY